MATIEFTGERYVPSLRGPIYYEHVHRYAMATRFCSGKRVLDIASGEGFGSALLARAAAEVTGVDIDPQAIDHARAGYYAPNLHFLLGTATEIPLADDSVDVIISFETIEHLDQHERMLGEFRRVLASGGVLVISSPNKLVYSDIPKYNNPYHVKELYFAEFRDLLATRFAHVVHYGQRLAVASVIQPVTSDFSDNVTWHNDTALQPGLGLPTLQEPLYFVAICSDEGVAVDVTSAFIDAGDDIFKAMNGELRRQETEIGAYHTRVTSDQVLMAALTATRDELREENERLLVDSARAADLEVAVRRLGAANERGLDVERHLQIERDRLQERVVALNRQVALLGASFSAAQHEKIDLRVQHDKATLALREQAARERLQLEQVLNSKSWKLAEWIRRLTNRFAGRSTTSVGIQSAPPATVLETDHVSTVPLRAYFDEAFYIARNPDLVNVADPFEHYRTYGSMENRQAHPLFDPKFYEEENPDVASFPGGAIRHYLTAGAIERRNPHPVFDSSGYANRVHLHPQEDPLHHYLTQWQTTEGEPHPLFDTPYYLKQRGPLQTPPLVDYLVNGGNGLFSPHILFNESYYLEHNRDVSSATIHPFVHFVHYAAAEGRSPHPWFDAVYYLSRYADVVDARVNPLIHFINSGSREGRSPHPFFNTAYYSQRYLASNWEINALIHYLQIGTDLGYSTSAYDEPEAFLPSTKMLAPEMTGSVDIVIPVYRDFDVTRRCVESVLTSDLPAGTRILVIDDASPEPGVSAYLRSLVDDARVTLLVNQTNRGFVGTVNRGMRYDLERDVVLLNSDTVVANDWLARLGRAAYSRSNVASVSPFSNNATICSFPRYCEINSISPLLTVEIDRTAAAVNAGRTFELPTAVGFCMYIRRDALNEVGLFDEAAFGKGYGEENDFCMRTAQQGMVHLLATDVFVYHEGEVSFSERAAVSKVRGMEALERLHPEYLSLVRRHIELDPALGARLALATAASLALGKPALLYVIHDVGGGTEQHALELASLVYSTHNVLRLSPERRGRVRLSTIEAPLAFDVTLDPKQHESTLLALIRALGVTRLHVHHTLGFEFDIEAFVKKSELPFDFTIHDYYTVCPYINLTDRLGVYCGEPDEAGCNRCIEDRPPYQYRDISAWRDATAWMVRDADRVIAPSDDVAERMQRYFPEVDFVVASHL